jgi:hypothetical protein
MSRSIQVSGSHGLDVKSWNAAIAVSFTVSTSESEKDSCKSRSFVIIAPPPKEGEQRGSRLLRSERQNVNKRIVL